MSRLIEVFTKHSAFAGLSPDLQARVRYLVTTSFILMAFFFLATFSKYREDPSVFGLFALLVGIVSLAFPLTLFLLRFGHYKVGMVVTIVALFINLQWMGFLMPIESPIENYRYLSYTFATVIVVCLIAWHVRIVVVYGLACMVAELLVCMLVYAVPEGKVTSEITTVLFFGEVGIASLTLVSVQLARFTALMIELMKREIKTSEQRNAKLKDLIDNSNEALRSGNVIIEHTQVSQGHAMDIEKAARELEGLMRHLSEGGQLASQALAKVNEYVQELRNLSGESAVASGDNSRHIEGLLGTMDSMARQARERQEGIRFLAETVDARQADMDALRRTMEETVTASARFSQIVASIADIAEETSLLAMNASIEAAHAGATGKGFGVIAGRIKKLAEAARVSSTQVAGIMSENRRDLENSLEKARENKSYFDALAVQVQSTVQAMESLINGFAGMSEGTLGIGAATQRLGQLSELTRTMAGNIEKEVEVSSGVVGGLTRTSVSTLESLTSMENRLLTIRTSLDSLSAAGKASLTALRQLEEGVAGQGQE